MRCWGDNPGAFLGYGNVGDMGDDELPSDMPPLNVGGPAIQVATGGEFTCVLLATRDIRCWGHNHLGQLGYGHTYTLGDAVDEMPTPPVQVN